LDFEAYDFMIWLNCKNCLFQCNIYKNNNEEFKTLYNKAKSTKSYTEFKRLCKQIHDHIYDYVTGEVE